VTVLTFTSMSPDTGPVGTSVIISGAGFTGATDVSFNGVGAVFGVDTDSQITTTVPFGATTGLVTVTSPNGTVSSAADFTVT
jgi:IPT/TIG domain